MSAFAETKSDFLRAAAQAGWTSPAEVTLAWRDSLPEHILARWLRQLTSTVKIDPASPKRLVNHFKLGADPEFVFLREDGDKEPAGNFGFKAALAWGADNNGRLCEIRPSPDRHALAVCASVWATLQWMPKFQPACLGYAWRSGAWIAGDGVGGHIHFGRKRPTWAREMSALDTLAFWLQYVNIFNQAEWRERIRRTRGHGNYGQLGDRREQVHGWEYRTIPSWLDSPWLAYFVLTLGKLAVFDPEFLPPLDEAADTQSTAIVRAKLRGMLNYFKGRDDDAALAHQILGRQGWPHFETTDFKARWGIFGNPVTASPLMDHLVPSMVPATAELVVELGTALVEGRVPEWTDCPPTWQPYQLPSGYQQVLVDTSTYHHPGVGELVRDLVVSSLKTRPRIMASGNSRIDLPTAVVPRPFEPWLQKMRQKFPDLVFNTYTPESSKPEHMSIYVPGENASNPHQRQQTIDFLVEGWAPIWRASEVQADSLAKWTTAHQPKAKPTPKTPRAASRVIFPLTAAEPKKKTVAVPPLNLNTLRSTSNERANRLDSPWTTATTSWPQASNMVIPPNSTIHYIQYIDPITGETHRDIVPEPSPTSYPDDPEFGGNQ